MPIDILASFLLAFWPLMVMMSPMMFDAPGSTNDRGAILGAFLFLGYPVLLAFVYVLFGWSFWGVGGKPLLLVSMGLVGAVLYLGGYFQLLFLSYRGILADGYSVSEQVVYYHGKPLDGADAESFRVLGAAISHDRRRYAVDADHVYYFGEVIEGASPDRFSHLETTSKSYWADDEHVYESGKVLVHARPDTFEDLGTGWALSRAEGGQKGYVYYHGKLVEGADPESFTLLEGNLAKDKDRIFDSGAQILPEADAESFGLYAASSDYAYDKHHVFRIGDWREEPRVLEGFDPKDFVPLGMGYVKASNRVYYENSEAGLEELSGADARSFDIYPGFSGYAFDKDHVYYYCDGRAAGILEGFDPAEFVPLQFRYVKTANKVYYDAACGTLEEMKGADVSTFEVGFFESNPEADAKDSRGYFVNGRQLSY